MSSLYRDLAATANQLLAEFGASATLKTQGVATYDAATSSRVVPHVSKTVKCAVFDFADQNINGTLVLAGDKDCYMSASGGVTPRTGDVLVWGGVEYGIVRSKPLAPALIAVLWQLQLRAGG